MAEARSRAWWAHTSHVLCLIANTNRDPKRQRRPFRPNEFNPHTAPRRRARPVSLDRLTDEMVRVAESRKRGGR